MEETQLKQEYLVKLKSIIIIKNIKNEISEKKILKEYVYIHFL